MPCLSANGLALAMRRCNCHERSAMNAASSMRLIPKASAQDVEAMPESTIDPLVIELVPVYFPTAGPGSRRLLCGAKSLLLYRAGAHFNKQI